MKIPTIEFKSWNAAALFVVICFVIPLTGIIAWRYIDTLFTPAPIEETVNGKD